MVRVLSGTGLAAAVFFLVWFAGPTLLLVVAAGVCVVLFREYARLMHAIGAPVPAVPALVATLAALVVVPVRYAPPELVVGFGVIAIAAGALAEVRASPNAGTDQGESEPAPPSPAARRAGLGTAAGVLSIVYLGLPLGALLGVHRLAGRETVLLLIAVVAVSDTVQYYAGRVFGRRTLAPRLSPGKTVEGALGGLMVAPALLSAAGPYVVTTASRPTLAMLGVALVAAGIAGDLFESALKRAAGLKDSAALVPGHGGALDRVDALLFATPVFYAFVRWLEGA